MIAKAILAALVLLPMAAPVAAHQYTVGSLVIDHPWARATPPGARVAGGYLTITNRGKKADRLIGGTAASAQAVEVHESSVSADGIARMRPLAEGLLIPPGETVTLQPGGVHLMIIAPTKALKIGESYSAALRFESAGEVPLEFDVVSIGGQPASEVHGSPQ